MDLRRILAANIMRIRREKGFSQEALAWEAGIARRYMTKIERSETSTGVDVLAKIADALKVDPAELLASPRRTKN